MCSPWIAGPISLPGKFRQDERVTVLEQTSARILTIDHITRECNWVVCDASFIGLAKVLDVPISLAAPQCQLVALIKPQFEVARAEVGKRGVVSDPALHNGSAMKCATGWKARTAREGIVQSPITGPEGNVEFLIAAQRG